MNADATQGTPRSAGVCILSIYKTIAPVTVGHFQFFDPGPLIDNELHLVALRPEWIDEILAACAHPLTLLQAPHDASLTREQLEHLLEVAPDGCEPADPLHGRAPQYHFWMRLRDQFVGKIGSPPIRMLGGIGLRVGTTPSVQLYYGNFGYHVYPPARGRNYAQRACGLLLPLAKKHGLNPLWITCNPDNFASRTTCEHLGAAMTEIVTIPEAEPLYARGERYKCRYRLDL